MFYLSEQERIARLEGEVVMWFRQAQEEHQRAEQMAARVRELNAQLDAAQDDINELKKLRADDADRFEAITAYINAAQKTGYQTSWNIGAMTYDAIREQTIAANAHKAPPTVMESDLVVVGKMDREGALYRKNVIVPHGSTVEVVYAYRPKKASIKIDTDKTSKVKGKPNA